MALPMPTSMGDNMYNVALPNLTAASVAYIPITRTGRIKRFAEAHSVVTATGNATLQLAYAPPGSSTSPSVATGLLTIPSGTAAGLCTTTDLGPSTDAYVQDGGTLRITVGGTATGGGVPQATINVGV